MRRPRIAVVSPFIDKCHGTERRVAEWVSRLTGDYEFHVYSERVNDLDLSKIVWHRVHGIPGPHLIKYLWWFAANHLQRWWDRRFRGLRADLVYSPGINCMDAGAISVHIVFAEFYRQIQPELRFRQHPVSFWPRLLHRKLYYRFIILLERRIYSRMDTSLILIARKTAEDLKRFYGRTDTLPVVYLGLDHQIFNPEARKALRSNVRKQLELEEGAFVLLLIGNDWRKKGLATILEALKNLKNARLHLLVAGQDDSRPYQKQIQEYSLDGKVHFLPLRPDVIAYYAAGDVYVGPSVEDTFAQPPAEAMACGLPVITSVTNGTSEVMTDGVDGLILEDPTDAEELARLIRRLYEDAEFRRRLGENAARTAQQYTWENNAAEMRALFEQARRVRDGASPAVAARLQSPKA